MKKQKLGRRKGGDRNTSSNIEASHNITSNVDE